MKNDDSKDIKLVNPEAKIEDDQYPSPEGKADIIADEQSQLNATKNADGSDGNFSAVAMGRGSKRFLIIGLIIAALTAIYFIYKNARDENVVEKTPTEKIIDRSESEAKELIKNAKPVPSIDQNDITEAPKLPAPLPIKAPQPPEPPPPPVPLAPQSPMFPQLSNNQSRAAATTSSYSTTASSPSNYNYQGGISDPFTSKEDEQAKLKALEARRKSSIMVLGGSGAAGNDPTKDAAGNPKDPKDQKSRTDKSGYLGFGEGSFGESAIGKTKFAQVKATHIGRLDNLIAQGKLIHAVLETAINTDLPGTLRAIIARDVYAESGNAVLIPKGSRVIGTYDSQVKTGHDRVAIAWDRVIRPDGIDIAISSQGSDVLGRSGAAGFLDNKFLTKLGNALLISYVVPTAANKIFSKGGNNTPITTTASTNAATGITTTSSTSTFQQQQLKESEDKFNEIMSKAIQDSFSVAPTIFIDQGTEVNIFVNRDLVFPDEAMMGSSRVIK